LAEGVGSHISHCKDKRNDSHCFKARLLWLQRGTLKYFSVKIAMNQAAIKKRTTLRHTLFTFLVNRRQGNSRRDALMAGAVCTVLLRTRISAQVAILNRAE